MHSDFTTIYMLHATALQCALYSSYFCMHSDFSSIYYTCFRLRTRKCAANRSALDTYYAEPAFAALTATHNGNESCYEIELRQLVRHLCDSYGYNYYSVAQQSCEYCACIRNLLSLFMLYAPRALASVANLMSLLML